MKIASNRQPWTASEDEQLKELIATTSPVIWTEIATKFKNRTGKQCRERWVNHLNPEINEGDWTYEEDEQLFNLHEKVGNKWASIARVMQGRSENSIKNRWYSSITKRIIKDQYGNTILNRPISRGRTKKAVLRHHIPPVTEFMSVPIIYPCLNLIVAPTMTSVIDNNNIIDPYASVPIKIKQQEPVSLMLPNFPPGVFPPAISTEVPTKAVKNSQLIESHPTSNTVESSLTVQSLMNPNFPTSKPNPPTLTVRSLMNPNFPPLKASTPSMVLHTNNDQLQSQK